MRRHLPGKSEFRASESALSSVVPIFTQRARWYCSVEARPPKSYLPGKSEFRASESALSSVVPIFTQRARWYCSVEARPPKSFPVPRPAPPAGGRPGPDLAWIEKSGRPPDLAGIGRVHSDSPAFGHWHRGFRGLACKRPPLANLTAPRWPAQGLGPAASKRNAGSGEILLSRVPARPGAFYARRQDGTWCGKGCRVSRRGVLFAAPFHDSRL